MFHRHKAQAVIVIPRVFLKIGAVTARNQLGSSVGTTTTARCQSKASQAKTGTNSDRADRDNQKLSSRLFATAAAAA